MNLLEIVTDKFPMFPKRDDYAYFEYFQGVDYITKRIALSFILSFLSLFIAYPMAYLVSQGFGAEAWIKTDQFYRYLLNHPLYIFERYYRWILIIGKNPWQSFSMWIPAFPFFGFVFGVLYAIKSNPYYFSSQELGGGRLADDNDIKRLGLDQGFTFVIGNYEDKKLLKMNNYMSCLIVGASGTGKSTGIYIPTILENDDKCLFINDFKGELYEATAGHRAQLGPVYRVDFCGEDNPKAGEFWPTWNPLSDKDLPPPCPGRQNYIGGLAYFLLDDGPTGTDPYWIKTGRSVLEGFINYICDKCEQARANDYFLQRLYENAMDDEDYEVIESYYDTMEKSVAVKQALNNVRKKTLTFKNYVPIGTWDRIPEAWVGRQASFPMMLDMITKLQLDLSAQLRARRDAGDPIAFKTDVWSFILNDMIDEAKFYGYNRRVVVELSQIAALPKTQRSSILSMALSGLAPFKNAIIRARTASSDFGSLDLRGTKNLVTGKWEPTTFYMGCPVEGMTFKMYNMFINMYSGTPIIFAPNEGPAGPFPLLFLLDEFCMTGFHVADAIGTGMSKQFSFLLSCTDFEQLGASFGGEMETLIGNTGCKIFMQVNTRETASRINSLIETKTVTTFSTARDEGIGTSTSLFTPYFVMYGSMADNVVSNDSWMTLPHGTHYAIIQKNSNRLIKLKTPFFFNDRKMVKMSKIPAPNPLSIASYNARAAEDKLPPPEDMSVEPEYLKARKIGDVEQQEEEQKSKDEKEN